MEPETEYKVIFKARGNGNENIFRFYVYNYYTEKKTQGDLGYIKLNNSWNTYELSFKTDTDIKPGTQYLAFQINENNGEYVDIEEIIILRKINNY